VVKLFVVVKMKTRTVFRCQECGYESVNWLGRCPNCDQYGTFVEEKRQDEQALKTPPHRLTEFTAGEPVRLTEIESKPEKRFPTGLKEFDNILGGGVVPGSLILIGGAPGIGKSTLLLQIAGFLGKGHKFLYVSGEESVEQTKNRARRLHTKGEGLWLVSEVNLENIISTVGKISPEFLVIDSIQTVYKSSISGAPGSVGQIRECTAELLSLAKSQSIVIFISGHITKEGAIAGPRVLEHIVDVVLYFEGEQNYSYRILRAYKNRFGSINEIGVFEMGEEGLVGVKNPSEIFLSGKLPDTPGSVVSVSLEGSRSLLVEVQALTSPTNFGYPQRRASGVDYLRICLLLAVLEKRLKLSLGGQDVFVNIAGGLKVNDPAVDLGMALAIISSFRNSAIADGTVVMGEVGLGGEVRRITYPERRITESLRLGFKKIILPRDNLEKLKIKEKAELKGVKTVAEAVALVMRKCN